MRPSPRASLLSLLSVSALVATAGAADADATYQPLPYAQDWSNTAMIQLDDDWSQVPGVIGRYGYPPSPGQYGIDPRSLNFYDGLGDTLFANLADPSSLAICGIAEFDALTDPVVALQTDYVTSVLYLMFHLDTSGYRDITVSYRLRDLDGSAANSVQQFVLQYRVGDAGPWMNVEGTYVPDATHGPNMATLETSVHATLPAGCSDIQRLQLRIVTTNPLVLLDEWVGVDDISVHGTPIAPGARGVDLGWSSCAVTAATASRVFDCADNGSGFSLVGSFRTDVDVPDFVGVSAFVDVTTAAPTPPPWFQFGGGMCREGAIALTNVGPLAACANPYADAEQGGGYVVETGTGTGQIRIWLDWARDVPTTVAASVRNAAFVLNLGTANSVDEGFGSCPGCQTPACFVLTTVEVHSASQGLMRLIHTPNERNWATWQSGAGSCPGATPARKSSWGAVKALYR